MKKHRIECVDYYHHRECFAVYFWRRGVDKPRTFSYNRASRSLSVIARCVRLQKQHRGEFEPFENLRGWRFYPGIRSSEKGDRS